MAGMFDTLGLLEVCAMKVRAASSRWVFPVELDSLLFVVAIAVLVMGPEIVSTSPGTK
jgi:hypothetical protein